MALAGVSCGGVGLGLVVTRVCSRFVSTGDILAFFHFGIGVF